MNVDRKNIEGRKIWNDGDNIYKTRPNTVTINLLRDGEIYKSIELDSFGDGKYKFDCLPSCKNVSTDYNYTIEEVLIPNYQSKIVGNDVVNKLDTITITGTKVWRDNNNQDGIRPATITVILLQNGIPVREIEVNSPIDTESEVEFSFADLPVFDNQDNLFVYSVDELNVTGYGKKIIGNNIINTLSSIFCFTVNKKDIVTDLGLEGATFEITHLGSLVESATSNTLGEAHFSCLNPGIYQLTETVAPTNYIGDEKIYQVVVLIDGTVTIDGAITDNIDVYNTPAISISGTKVWIDQSNSYNTRPTTMTINLLQDGVVFKQKDITTSNGETSFTFENLPEYKLDGTKYIYTLEEAEVPNGYDSVKVTDTRFENTLKEFTITIFHMDTDNREYLYITTLSAYYGSTITLNAPVIDQYNALEPTTYTFTVTKDEDYTFEYKHK